MKRAISVALIAVMMLGSIGLIACGAENETTSPSDGGTTPPSGGTSWDDVPVYSGAKQVQKGSWSIPPAEGEWAKVEWRYYETGDSVSKVAAFYRAEMSNKGWDEMAWFEMQEINWGSFSKNGEQDAAMVWTGSDEGKTFIALMRASK